MNKHGTEDRTLAFAGILQALQLVQQTAYGKPCDLTSMQASLGSILVIDTASVEAVYGGIDKLRPGLLLLKTQLIGEQRRPDAELSRYLVTLLHLERKLSKRSDLLDRLRSGIERAQAQAEHFDVVHDNLVASLADLYTNTVSSLQPRIMVNGQPERLSDTGVANRVRALLLAAIRSAVLWRQCGGTRIGLIFGRKKMVEMASALLERANSNESPDY
jgi:high frequency lysogenization protein